MSDSVNSFEAARKGILEKGEPLTGMSYVAELRLTYTPQRT